MDQRLRHDQRLMRRALDLATAGRGLVEPNPLVGCVIARNADGGGDPTIIGEGFHGRFGGPHAEPTALANCRQSPAGATAYVTLEPCCHSNKKTPPCVPALIGAKVARVVVGCVDPNPAVSGRGIAQLRAAGIAVDIGVLEASARQLIAPFIKGCVHALPYVTLKWAQSADGKVAGPAGRRRQISGPEAMRAVDDLRGRCDAIMVGIGTVLADDPRLLVRQADPPRRPIRVVLDTHLRLPVDCQLVRTVHESPLVVYCGEPAAKNELAGMLASAGVTVVPLPLAGDHVDVRSALTDLAKRGVTHMLVEPGPTLGRMMLEANLADRVWVFRSPVRIDDDSAPAGPTLPYVATASLRIGSDILSEALNPHSPVFFAADPSPDLLLAGGG